MTTEYRVHFEKSDSLSVTVEADTPESAIEEAYQEIPGLCAQCCGWGQSWSREDDGEATAVAVTDPSGKTVWDDR